MIFFENEVPKGFHAVCGQRFEMQTKIKTKKNSSWLFLFGMGRFEKVDDIKFRHSSQCLFVLS